jgi:hypothetical protein
VIDSEANVRRLLQEGPAARPGCVDVEGWQQVEHGLFALALDYRDQRLTEAPQSEDWQAVLILQSCARLVLGADAVGDQLSCQAFAYCEDEAAAATLAQTLEAFVALGRTALVAKVAAKPEDDRHAAVLPWAMELLDGLRIDRQGAVVRARSQARAIFVELMELNLSGKQ